MKFIKISITLSIIILIILSSVYYGKKWISTSPLFIVGNIKISGHELVKEKSILDLVNSIPEKQILKIRIDTLKNKILSNKLIKNVSIKRIYPSTISIEIKEKKPPVKLLLSSKPEDGNDAEVKEFLLKYKGEFDSEEESGGTLRDIPVKKPIEEKKEPEKED